MLSSIATDMITSQTHATFLHPKQFKYKTLQNNRKEPNRTATHRSPQELSHFTILRKVERPSCTSIKIWHKANQMIFCKDKIVTSFSHETFQLSMLFKLEKPSKLEHFKLSFLLAKERFLLYLIYLKMITFMT